MREETAKKIAAVFGYPAIESDRDPVGFVELLSQSETRVDIDISEAPISSLAGACGFGWSGDKVVAKLVELLEGEGLEYSFVCEASGRVLVSEHSPFAGETRSARERAEAEAAYHREHRGDGTARAECRPIGPDFDWEPVT
jgi:hypothetical protein